MKNKTTLYITGIFICVLVSYRCSGQAIKIDFNEDAQKNISKVVFDKLVDSCVKLLEEKQLLEISDSGHIDIMMCLNTFEMAHNKTDFTPVFRGGRYAKLDSVSAKKEYAAKIVSVYKEWTPDRGMGYYFPKLKMEFGGTPHLFAYFNVIQ